MVKLEYKKYLERQTNNGEFMYYLNNFFIFSIFGHFLESILFFVIGSNRQSGYLYLWWTPVYGYGVLIAMFFYDKMNGLFKKKWLIKVMLFISFLLFFSLFEYLGGIILEKIYGKSFWNYSKMPLHIGKYVSFLPSLVWAFGGLVYLLFLKKYTDKIVSKIPKEVTYAFLLIFIFDNICSLIKIFIK